MFRGRKSWSLVKAYDHRLLSQGHNTISGDCNLPIVLHCFTGNTIYEGISSISIYKVLTIVQQMVIKLFGTLLYTEKKMRKKELNGEITLKQFHLKAQS
jgi:hypothetical protein